jgi:hypothetical protein
MGFYFISSWKKSPFVGGSELFACWPESQDWNSLSLLQTCLRASVTTYEGEQSRNSAYFVSLSFASSSSLSWTTGGFGLFGWRFQNWHCDFLLSVFGISPFLYSVCLLLCMHAAKTYAYKRSITPGATPKTFWAGEGRPEWGRSRREDVSGRVHSCCPLGPHLFISLPLAAPFLRKLV